MTNPSSNRTDRVMVIDDDIILREVLPLLLEAKGHAIFTAESGKDALNQLSKLESGQLPTVILTDLRMPDTVPSALAIRLRLACPEPALLLAMSASEPAADDVAGFDGFLLKPFQVADYDAAVAEARTRADKAEASPLRYSSDSVHDRVDKTPDVQVLDEAIYIKLSSVMGAAQLPQLYTLFLEDATMRVDRMRSAISGNDLGTFTREAHAIKGGCGMLGATELYSLASRLETGGFAFSSLLDDFQPALERLRRILEKRMNRHIEERESQP